MSVLDIYDGDRKGMVLRIERSSIHDGPGLRTVVFLKGCPLRCQWCSTPESQSFEIEHTAENTYGTVMTVEQVMKELRKDSLFFFISTGGITLSGGEILAQPEFAKAILKNSRKECMHTAIETTFFGQWETIEEILPYVNLAFVDMKFFSSDLHKKYCGVDNSLILENLLKTNDSDARFQLAIRTPVIPGLNDSEEELRKIGEFCTKLKKLSYFQLLPYHKLGTATYAKLGRPYLLGNVASPTAEQMDHYANIMKEYVPDTIY